MQKIYILVGSSGSGKTTLMEELIRKNPDFAVVKSVTTRKPRGVPEPNYRFVSPEEFENLKKEGGLLEWSTYAGNSYGTAISDMEAVLSSGKNAIKAMNLPGALAAKQAFGDKCVTVFLKRHRDQLIRSILDRKTEDADIIARIGYLTKEEDQSGDCDEVLCNDGTVEDLYQKFMRLCE